MTSPFTSDIVDRSGRVRAVCLDVDDTLVDYLRTARTALAALIGRDDAWPIWERANAEHFARLLTGQVDYETMRRDRARTFYADLGELLDESEIAEREARRRAAMERSWRLYPDTLPCLEWLRSAGVRVAAITNASGAHQRAKLSMLGIAEFFDEVVIAGELGAAKPDPAIFRAAALALGVPVAATVHVGDRLDLDAVGACDAGMRGVWLDRGAEPVAVPPGVSVITSLDQLPGLLALELAPPLSMAAPAAAAVA
ncbi:haloacid dehalogenase [Longimycelium tulufanense]|uniref:Haloacid dehalogenase n=1 Tax=Longimycelium tulufanense TaxID=907463 RepID=A0A8J3C9S6_9PSEU|nr:HAD family hydrolase [Longimycelium tulufanense]GGM36559.1 haloacid dehalogenase [Longimycelium tulufanense]